MSLGRRRSASTQTTSLPATASTTPRLETSVDLPSSGSALVTRMTPPSANAPPSWRFARTMCRASITSRLRRSDAARMSTGARPRAVLGSVPITGALNHSSASRRLRTRLSRLSRANANTRPSASPSAIAIARFRLGLGEICPGWTCAGSKIVALTGSTSWRLSGRRRSGRLACRASILTRSVKTAPILSSTGTSRVRSVESYETSSTELFGRTTTSIAPRSASGVVSRPRSEITVCATMLLFRRFVIVAVKRSTSLPSWAWNVWPVWPTTILEDAR